MKKEDGRAVPIRHIHMKKINFFKQDSNLYPFRWFIVLAIALTSCMAYADYTGWDIFGFNGQERWSASGPGTYHK